MPKRRYVEVTVSELLSDLNRITDDRTVAKGLLDEVIETYQTEVQEKLAVKAGKKTQEQVDTDRIKRRGSRYHTNKLRKNMIAAGKTRFKNSSPHHIVAWNDYRAEEARNILAQVGIGIDDAVNGVFLPMYRKHTPHPDMPDAHAHLTVHTDIYYLNIEELLREEQGDKEGIKAVLKDIAEELTDGTFPLHEKI